jgi:hypothetical protein
MRAQPSQSYMRTRTSQARMTARTSQPDLRTKPSRSRGSRWFMILSLLAMVVVLSLVGRQPHRPLRSGAPATSETTSPAASTTTDEASIGNQSTFDGSAVGNN